MRDEMDSWKPRTAGHGLSGMSAAFMGPRAQGVAMTRKRKWVQGVKTVSTFPPKGIFTKDAKTIARVMASKEVSPKGLASGVRMIQFFINRAGNGLSPERKRELVKAREIMQEQMQKRK
jgi:tRNA(adenine34) deaminase